LLVDMVRLSRSTLLLAEPGSEKSAVIRSSVMPLLNDAKTGATAELAILVDAWDKAPLPALYNRIRESVADLTTSPLGAADDESSLAASLRALQDALGVTFLFIFDRFEEYLRAPSGRVGFESFENELVEVIRDPTLRANFLLSLDEEAEPLLSRLRERIPRLGYSRVRLPRATGATPLPSDRAAPTEPSALPFRVAPIAPAAASSRRETRAPVAASADLPAKVSTVPTPARATKSERAAAKQSSVVRAFGQSAEPVSALRAQEHTKQPEVRAQGRQKELEVQTPEMTLEVRTPLRADQANVHAEPQQQKPEVGTQEREKQQEVQANPPDQKPELRTQEREKELEVLARVREQTADAQTQPSEKARETRTRALQKAPEVQPQASVRDPAVQPQASVTEPALQPQASVREPAVQPRPPKKEPAVQSQPRKKPVMPTPHREKEPAVQTLARQKTAAGIAAARPSVRADAVPILRGRTLARLAWVPVALSVAGVFLFLQLRPQQTGDRIAQADTKRIPMGEAAEADAAPQQSAVVPSDARKKESISGTEQHPAPVTTPSAPKVAGGTPTSAQAQSEAATAPSKSAGTTGPGNGAVPAPSRQAETSVPKAAPAATSPPVPAPAIAQPARPPEAIAKSSPPVTTQPARQPESTVKPPAPAPSPSARAPEVAISKPPSAAIQPARPSDVGKPVPAARTQIGSAETPAGPRLYINVRNEAQRAWAEQIIRPLADRGIRVAGIRIVSSGPDNPDLRYYNLSERDEAIRVAVALRDFGLRAQQLKHIDETAGQATQRQYELWLGYDQRP
jgi:hypothetical protein